MSKVFHEVKDAIPVITGLLKLNLILSSDKQRILAEEAKQIEEIALLYRRFPDLKNVYRTKITNIAALIFIILEDLDLNSK